MQFYKVFDAIIANIWLNLHVKVSAAISIMQPFSKRFVKTLHWCVWELKWRVEIDVKQVYLKTFFF